MCQYAWGSMIIIRWRGVCVGLECVRVYNIHACVLWHLDRTNKIYNTNNYVIFISHLASNKCFNVCTRMMQ